jgi:hypothetical protein
VRLAGERVARSARLAALLIPANEDRRALSGRRELLILARVAKRRPTEMAIDLDRLPPLAYW